MSNLPAEPAAASPFELASGAQPIPGRPGVYRATVPDGWQQGRGAFGGLVLALLVRAMELEQGDASRRVRALTGDICGPVLPGEVELRASVLRRGKNQTNLRADLWQGDTLLATATALASSARSAPLAARAPAPPALPPFAELPILPVAPPMGPVFAAHYEYRANAHFPFTGGEEAIALGTIRERVVPRGLDAPALVALLDSYWPAIYATETAPRAMATVSFAAQLLLDPASLDPEERLIYRARAEAASEGFCVELRELWSGDRLVALNQQTFVVLA